MKRRAMSLGEILLALALMSIVLVSATMILQWALRGNIEQRQTTEAAFLAQKVTEELWSRPALPPASQGQEQGKVWKSSATPADQMTDLTVAIYSTDASEKQLYRLTSRRRAFKRIVLIQNKAGIWQKHEDLAKMRLIAPGVTSEFSVSADCTKIAYSRLEDGLQKLVWASMDQPDKVTSLIAPPLQTFDPCFSPDGNQLAFTAYIDNHSQVCLAEVATGKWTNRSISSNEEGSATWTPDGKGLLWLRDGTQVVLSQGNAAQVVLSGEDWKAKPRLSPDRAHITYTKGQNGGPNVAIYDLRSQKVTELTQKSYHIKPVYSQDGQRILYRKDKQLFTMNIDGTGNELLWDFKDDVGDFSWLGVP